MSSKAIPAEYYFKEGCYIQELHNSADDETMSIAHVRVEPGKVTRLHFLIATTERYAILKGAGQVTVGERSWMVSTGDVVVIEAGEAQKIRNTQEQDLVFLAICNPRFIEENYREIEE